MEKKTSQWDVKPAILTTVSPDKLKKFEELKQRRNLLCGKSTTKRVDHIRQQATDADFYGSDILQDVGYEAKPRAKPRGTCGKRSRKRRRQEDKTGDLSTSNGESKQEETKWQGLKQFLDPNPQLKGTSQQDDPKSGLEERLEDAITEGDLNKATELSDTLSNRQFLTKIAGAFDCKQYLDKLKEDEKQKKSKKQKLQWRFDIKERWETKSNM